jgi:hypothetical protein
MNGVVDTIVKNGEVVAERRRFDTRLSIAVLNRLDKRCDRAEEQGSRHLALVRNWDEYLQLIGKGDDDAARALMESDATETTFDSPLGPLPESENPTAPLHPPGCDPSENCWRAGSAGDLNPTRGRRVAEGAWITVFPPPPGFDGYQNVEWDGDTWYERACTEEEAELLDAHEAAKAAAEQAEIEAEAAELTAYSEAERDSWFDKLRSELAANRHAELVSASIAEEPGADGDRTGAGESP